jgi:uncharacterized membrane protein YkoI
MPRNLTLLLAITALAAAATAAKLTLNDLPAAVRQTVNDTLKGGEIKNISKETEHGVVQYEIETVMNGKHRDFDVDTKGTLLVVEEETAVDAIPAPAKAAILKKVGDGKLRTVESSTKPGGETVYEAAWTSKAGKKSEVLVKADGSPTR